MSENVKAPVAGSAQPATKKNRRGISNETKAVANLKFHEKDATNNGLFIAHLESVSVDWATAKDGAEIFIGCKIPRLTIHFASNHPNVSEQRHCYHSLFPIQSNVDTIPGGKSEWQVNNVLNMIKHLLDTFYLKGRAMTEAEEDALSLPFCDFDDEGNYVAVEEQDVCNGYAVVFENAVAMLNGTFGKSEEEAANAKPTYKTADGKFISIWLKLLRHKKRKDAWVNVTPNGDLGLDSFIGNGLIEILKPNTNPAILRLDLSRESIIPKETKKTPTVGAPGVPSMAGGIVAMPAGGAMMGAADNQAYTDAGGDMPF